LRLHCIHVTPRNPAPPFSPSNKIGRTSRIDPRTRNEPLSIRPSSPLSDRISTTWFLSAQYSLYLYKCRPRFPSSDPEVFLSVLGIAAPLHQQWIRSGPDPVQTPELGSECSSRAPAGQWEGCVGWSFTLSRPVTAHDSQSIHSRTLQEPSTFRLQTPTPPSHTVVIPPAIRVQDSAPPSCQPHRYKSLVSSSS
jgi:hypothetical protein